jgi:hypothetical protein
MLLLTILSASFSKSSCKVVEIHVYWLLNAFEHLHQIIAYLSSHLSLILLGSMATSCYNEITFMSLCQYSCSA